MKYFLDFGTNYFQGLREFSAKLGIDSSWNVKCYEADPYIFSKALLLSDELKLRDLYSSFSFSNLAISDADDQNLIINCITAFGFDSASFSPGDFGGSSTVQRTDDIFTKNSLYRTAIVRSIDVNGILNEIVRNDSDAEIYIKCDTEGAEFIIIPRLLCSKNLRSVKHIFVEWHARFWKDSEDQQLIKQNWLIQGLLLNGVHHDSHY